MLSRSASFLIAPLLLGIGYDSGKPVTETKGTSNSHSSLKLRPWTDPNLPEAEVLRVLGD